MNLRQTYERISRRLTRMSHELRRKSLDETDLFRQARLGSRAMLLGEVAQFFTDLCGLRIYKATSSFGTVMFVGQDLPEATAAEVEHVFLGDASLDWKQEGTTSPARLTRFAKEQLARGVELIIYETSTVTRLARMASYKARVPVGVDMMYSLPADPTVPMSTAGDLFRDKRPVINRAEAAGFSYRISEDSAEFEHFYDEMYVPHVSKRHGRRAELAAPDGYLLKQFRDNGLLLITENGRPVAGGICERRGSIFDCSEYGVLDGDERLYTGWPAYTSWLASRWSSQAEGRRCGNAPRSILPTDRTCP